MAEEPDTEKPPVDEDPGGELETRRKRDQGLIR